MAFATGEVVATPGASSQYKVVFKMAGTVLNEWPVQSVAEGHAQIEEVLRGLRRQAIKDDV
jgi:hypothetical protein